MDNMNGDELKLRDDIPNVAIYTTKDDRLMMVRFDYNDGNLVITECELSENVGDDMITQFPELREDQVVFAKIAYEFDFDDDEGLMEISLHEIIDLHDDGNEICVEDIVKDNIQFMGEVYVEHIDNFYSFGI